MKKSIMLLMAVFTLTLFSGCVTGSDSLINGQIKFAAIEIQSSEDIQDAHAYAKLIEQGSTQLEQAVGKAEISAFDAQSLNEAIQGSKDEHSSLSFFSNAAKSIVSKIPYGDWALTLLSLLFGAGGLLKSKFTSKKVVSLIAGVDDVIESVKDKDYAETIKVILANRQNAMGVGEGIKSDMAKLKASGILKPSTKTV